MHTVQHPRTSPQELIWKTELLVRGLFERERIISKFGIFLNGQHKNLTAQEAKAFTVLETLDSS